MNRKVLALLWSACCLLAACGGHLPPNPWPSPTPPTPTPTPAPTPTPNPTPTPGSNDPLLRIGPQLQLTNLKGEPVKLRQFIVYWIPGNQDANSGWPIPRKETIDYAAAHGFKAIHMRLGPFIAKCAQEDDACGETLWADTGGGYNADGTINEAFASKVKELVAYAASKGLYVEIVMIDTWGCKVSQNGNPYNPWITLAPQSLANCGNKWDSVQDTWVRYWVKAFKDNPYVYWLLDNEGEQVKHPAQPWWDAHLAAIRSEEKGINHITGCTIQFAGPCDYTYTHEVGPVSVLSGKFTVNNEHNPAHYNVGEEVNNFSAGDQQVGVSYAFWEDDATDQQAVDTVSGIQSYFGGGNVACYAPNGDDPKWEGLPSNPPGPDAMAAQYNAAAEAVGNRCGATGQCTPSREPCSTPIFLGCQDTSDMIAQKLREAGNCASGSWGGGPEIALLDPVAQLWHQYHPCSAGDGCPTGTPWKATWRYNGTNPTPPGPQPTPTPTPPPSGCSNPQPPALSRFAMKESNKGPNWTTVDSTAIVHDGAYCAATGWTDGRLDCPTRPEGSTERAACDALIVGTPQWTGPGEVTSNPYVYRVRRGTSGPARVCGQINNACSVLQVTP